MNSKIEAAKAEAIFERASMARAAQQLNGLMYTEFEGLNGLDGFSVKKKLKQVKKNLKKAVKVIKKAAPLVVGAAAVYFTGGAAMPLLKAGAEKTMSNIQKKKLEKIAQENPQAVAELQNQPVEIAVQSPIVQKAAQQLAQDEAASQGLMMESDEAKQYIASETKAASEEVANKATKPIPTAAIVLPIIGITAALLA